MDLVNQNDYDKEGVNIIIKNLDAYRKSKSNLSKDLNINCDNFDEQEKRIKEKITRNINDYYTTAINFMKNMEFNKADDPISKLNILKPLRMFLEENIELEVKFKL